MKVHVGLDVPDLSTAPAAPAAGRSLIYVRSGRLYQKDSAGTEVPAGAASGAWTTWTPAVSGITAGVGTPVGRYRLLDQKTCAVRIRVPFTGAISGNGVFGVSLPFNPMNTGIQGQMFATLHDVSSADLHYMGFGEIRTTDTRLIPFWFNYPPNTNSAAPTFAFGPGNPPGGTIANGDYLICSGVYELA